PRRPSVRRWPNRRTANALRALDQSAALPGAPSARSHCPDPVPYGRGIASVGLQRGNPRMIPRYSRPEMTRIWSPENRYRIWFEIEAHACDAQAALGIIPESAARAVWERRGFEAERIDEIERETRH